MNDIDSEINALNANKACKSDSIPTKLPKEYGHICREPLKGIINKSIFTSNFDQGLKYAYLTLVHKKDDTTDKKIIDQSVYFLRQQRSLKNLCKNK